MSIKSIRSQPDITVFGMQKIEACITHSQDIFASLLKDHLDHRETTIDQYIRYLSFQYHLTKDVQRYFMTIAAHADLARRRKLRDFLVRFANEEELHYLVAANDLDKFGLKPMPMPFDVELWHSYFRGIVASRPFVRLGAATILENISSGNAKPWVKKALTGPFLTKDNTKFLVLHQHETLPHGDQLLEAITQGQLEQRHFDDLVEGAKKGCVLYIRMAEWALKPTSLASIADEETLELDAEELQRIRSFEMSELEATP